MTDNVIDARERFLGKVVLDKLEDFINRDPKFHPYYLLIEEEGENYIELRLHDLNTDSHIVLDKTPMIVIEERIKNGTCIVNLNG